MELKTQSNFKTTGLLQPWQTLCKIFSKCLTTRVTGWDQPPLQIMQMLYSFVNNIHVDYAKLLWEGLYNSLHHLTSSILYPRFTKIIINHYITIFPDISRHARYMYHNLQDDDIMKNIFNSGRHKNKVGMKIPDWMITDEMKQTEHYRMYTEVFGIDVPLTQSQPTESTHKMHRITSAPRSHNPDMEVAESSAPSRSTVIHLRLPERRSTRLTPPAPLPTVDKADEMILQDTLQVSLVEHKSREEQEARENVALVDEHLASEEIEKMVEEQENIVNDSSILRNDESNIPGTRIEPRSNKESPEETSAVDITNVIIPVNVTDEDEEITDEKEDKHVKKQVMQQVPEQVRNQVPVYVAEGLILERQKAKEKRRRLIATPIFCRTCGNIQAQIRHKLRMQIAMSFIKKYRLDIDEAKLRKVADEMLRQRYTSGDEHHYHIDQMKNFLKSDIVWDSRKEILKGNSRPEKIVLSLHKFLAIIFNDDDIEDRTSRWVNKSVKKFNHYARYGVEHWKNPHAKIFYIWKQKEPEKPKEEIYSNSKIIQPGYKNLNKNDIEDIYLLIMNGKIPDYADTGLLWSLSVFIRSSVIWERVHDFQLGIESYQQKYGYVQKDLTKDETEYLKLFEEEIKERLKHRRHMRIWEMYINGRPLRLRRERPE
ncbi:hypothetical protein Tco_0988420 [Tanacetum coccineum]|uniref:Uncharacterized protein n=1 Tax=Tanacetum coccineum TaxID=301880 RepID=A0ABQ5EQX0_9ASTR